MEHELISKLKFMVDKKRSLEEICEELEIEAYEVYGIIQLLKQNGYLYDIVDGQPVKIKAFYQNPDIIKLDSENQEEICLVSDIHYGSKYDRLDIIKAIYKECEKRGISTIFCCGDLTDGYYPNRPNHVYELRVIGADDTTDYVVKNHPYSKNIKFCTIGGNHDVTHQKNDGYDICRAISRQRDDIIYLGQDVADVQLDKLKLRLFHGKGANAYALSYKAQKYLDSIPLKERPDILQLGHIHQSFYMKQDDTHVLQTAALMDQTPFARSQGMKTERSCWFVKICYNGRGKVTKITPELMDFGPGLVRVRNK